MVKHLVIRVYGKVQGVYYRANSAELAKKLGIKGFARNEKDGSVYIEAEGEEKMLEVFVSQCYNHSSRATVEKIISEEGTLKNFSEFSIAYK